jgi:hypothetical protein
MGNGKWLVWMELVLMQVEVNSHRRNFGWCCHHDGITFGERMLSAKRAAARYEVVKFAEYRGVLLALILATRMKKTIVDTIFSLHGMGLLAWATERTLSMYMG